MGRIGFSYMGLAGLLLLWLPNMVFLRRQGAEYAALSSQERGPLLWMERIGQAGTTCCAGMFTDFDLRPLTAWSLWLLAFWVLLGIYEGCWVRYFQRPSLDRFYAPLGRIPVPLASLPVAAFLCLGMYGKVVWMLLSALVLGVGHIGLHLQHKKTLENSGL